MGAVDVGGPKKTAGGPSWKRPRIAIRIDMTPMVDIAFLLLIFFMVTTVFRLPQAMEMVLPEKQEKPSEIKVQEEKLITFLVLENDSLAYFVGNKAPQSLPWDSLREKLNERRQAMFAGTPEELRAIDRFLDVAGFNVIKFREDFGDAATVVRIDSVLSQTKIPELTVLDPQKLMEDIVKIDQLTVLGRIHKKARYHSLVDLVDEFNVAKTTRFSIDRYTTFEDSLLRAANFQTSGPEGLPEPEYGEEQEGS